MKTISIQMAKKRFSDQIIEISLERMNRLTVLNSDNIKSHLLNLVTQPGTRLELNVKELKFIDSSGFDCLNHISRVAKKHKSELALKNVQPELMEIIVLVKTHGVFDIKDYNISSLRDKVA